MKTRLSIIMISWLLASSIAFGQLIPSNLDSFIIERLELELERPSCDWTTFLKEYGFKLYHFKSTFKADYLSKAYVQFQLHLFRSSKSEDQLIRSNPVGVQVERKEISKLKVSERIGFKNRYDYYYKVTWKKDIDTLPGDKTWLTCYAFLIDGELVILPKL